jgi:hypothetical protein
VAFGAAFIVSGDIGADSRLPRAKHQGQQQHDHNYGHARCRMKPAPTRLAPEQLEALRRLDACALASAIETFQKRPRHEGVVDHSIRSIFPHVQPMVGFAATIKIRRSEGSMSGGIYPDRTDWWEYTLSVHAPRVIVVEDCSPRTGDG